MKLRWLAASRNSSWCIMGGEAPQNYLLVFQYLSCRCGRESCPFCAVLSRAGSKPGKLGTDRHRGFRSTTWLHRPRVGFQVPKNELPRMQYTPDPGTLRQKHDMPFPRTEPRSVSRKLLMPSSTQQGNALLKVCVTGIRRNQCEVPHIDAIRGFPMKRHIAACRGKVEPMVQRFCVFGTSNSISGGCLRLRPYSGLLTPIKR